jgi:hypothetical protein
VTKRKTKAEIREEARTAWLAENAADLLACGWPQASIDMVADRFAKRVADKARPTAKQRAQLRERETKEARARERYEAWRERAATGEPPEIPQTAQIVPPRNVVREGDTFTALAVVEGKERKLFQLPPEVVALRVADVARYALAIVYGHRKDNPLFAGELQASAGIAADHPLGYRRPRGRPAKLGRKPDGQFTRIEPITSGDVVRKVGDLVGKQAPMLREPARRSPSPEWSADPLGYLSSLMIGRRKRRLDGRPAPLDPIGAPQLRKAGQPPATAAAQSPASIQRRIRARRPAPVAQPRAPLLSRREQAKEEAEAKARGWYTTQRDLYESAGLLTEAAEALLRRCAGEYHKRLTGGDPPLRREVLDRWAAEQDAACTQPSEPWRHFSDDGGHATSGDTGRLMGRGAWDMEEVIRREWQEQERAEREFDRSEEFERRMELKEAEKQKARRAGRI